MAQTGKEPTVSSMIFLGTGTSSQVPAIGCLTDPKSACKVCPSALQPQTSKNRRRNTSAFFTLSNGKTILIDCGKSFFDAALQIWPRARLRQIDALLLTHAHADAMLGLDDLRGWTLGGFIQKTIHVYLTQATFDSVAQMFPYCVDAGKATGGGDIPSFNWHVIDEDSRFFVEPCNAYVQTLPVEHGLNFGSKPWPFICLGFQIGNVSYISDASAIPPKTREQLQASDGTSASRIMVLDALKHGEHPSHMGIAETLDFINKLDKPADKTFLLDFTHGVDHYQFEQDLKTGQKLNIAPAYDGLQLTFPPGQPGFSEVDLLASTRLIAVSEQDKPAKMNGHVPTLV